MEKSSTVSKEPSLEPALAKVPVKGRSLFSDARQRFLKHKGATISLVLLVLLMLAFFIAPLISSYDYRDTDFGAAFQIPSMHHLFGTDNLGRDIFVRTMKGAQITLAIGLIATLVSVVIGIAYGALSGFIGGRVDSVMMRAVDILYALPFLFLVILLMAFFGRYFILMFVAIGAISWLDMARIVRGQTLSLRRREFVEAAVVSGVGQLRIIFKHIVPNLLGIVTVYATLTIPGVILTAAFLSFLGLGVQEPMTSLGVLVNDGAQNMDVAWWTLVFPGVTLALVLLCFNFIGDGLRDAFDPRG